MDSSKLITLGAVGLGIYLLYEWLISQCETPSSPFFASSTCGMLLGTPAGLTTPVTTTPVTTTPTPVTSTPASTTASAAASLAALLTQTATAAGEDPTQLSSDQWSYYYQQIPGKPSISAATFGNILTSLGLTSATRSSIVSATAFASALVSNGLSGLGNSPFVASWVPASAIHGGWA